MKGKSKRLAEKKNSTAHKKKNKPKETAEPTEVMVLQFGANEVPVTSISDKVKHSYKESGNEEELKDIKIYVKPEENRAYYVANGEIEGSVELVSV